MQILTLSLLIVTCICCLDTAYAEYRYKIRGPPALPPPRGPAMPPQYMKKWHMPHYPPPRGPVRQRPIPLHGHQNFNKPNMKLSSPNRPLPPPAAPPIQLPMRNIWKSNPNMYNKVPEKPFQSSPTVKTPEYDYHIQTNNIPIHSNPVVKHADYKGPIHTIPAPNLSAADKPKNIEEVVKHETTVVQIQKAHQYQVTESPEALALYSSNNQQYYAPDLEAFNTQDISTSVKNHHQGLQPTNTAPINTQDLLKLLNSYNNQQQLLDTYSLPSAQQQQLQQHITNIQPSPAPYQTLVAQAALFQPEVSYANQLPQTFKQNYKAPFQPEYQSFNYEEPVAKQEDVYENLEEVRNPADALAQSQYVQRFFDTRDDNIVTNNVEPDARPAPQSFELEANKDDIVSGAFYTILPNRQAAESLASLQEAGKLNSVVSPQQSQSIQISPPIPMTIYVPDEYDDGEQTQEKRNAETHRDDAEDVHLDETSKTENARSKNRSAFGSRIKPKI